MASAETDAAEPLHAAYRASLAALRRLLRTRAGEAYCRTVFAPRVSPPARSVSQENHPTSSKSSSFISTSKPPRTAGHLGDSRGSTE